MRVFRSRRRVLGADIEFVADTRALLRLVDVAYRGLPRHALSRRTTRLLVRLRIASEAHGSEPEPPRLRIHGGNGLLCGVLNPNNFAIVSPGSGEALVVMSSGMLRHAYHARYELLEFAVYTLAARAQHLVSLHAACIGNHGKGLLLIGRSGAGKSTLAMNAMLQGWSLLSEDSVFVVPSTLLTTGVGTFLHVRTDAPSFGTSHDRWIRKSRVIRRRSGVEKFEVDLRVAPGRIARTALELAAVVFVSQRRARNGALLRRLSREEGLRRLTTSQAYAAGQSGWKEFKQKVGRLPALELRRGDPAAAIAALDVLLR